MHKLLALWCLPCTRSTDFERMMLQRGDFITHHEPFGLTYRYGEERRAERPPDVPVEAGLTFARTWRQLQLDAEKAPVFFKDFPQHVAHLLDEPFIARITHSFLIRDPRRLLPALHAEEPGFSLAEVGYRECHELFERLLARDGVPPPVIDTDELVRAPAAVVRRYCEALGLRFNARALKGPGMAWSRALGWRGSPFALPGLTPARRPEPARIDGHARLEEAYRACLPHYLAMRAYRLD